MREIRQFVKELDKYWFVNLMNLKLKTELKMKSEDYWKKHTKDY